MKNHFKRTFDCLELSAERQKEICSVLSAHIRDVERKPLRLRKRPGSLKILLAAAILMSAIALTGFAFGEQVYHLLGGGQIIRSVTEEGEDSVSVDTGFAVDPVIILDDQIYFTLDGSYTNITEECSETDYYSYETEETDGSRHIILVGGPSDHVGWAEFTLLSDGSFFSNATYDGEEAPEWLVRGRADVKAQWGRQP